MQDMQQNRDAEKRHDARIAANFIMDDRHSLPPEISKGLIFDEQRAEFKPKPREDHTLQLQEALNLYRTQDPDSDLVIFKNVVTWNDVYDTLKEAKSAYNETNKIRQFLRKTGDYGPAVTDKLDYAPDKSYINVVCKGLKFIFNVAIKLADKRKQILESFESIPERVQQMQDNDRFYKQDPDYRILREDFDSHMLMSISKSIRWLVKKSAAWKAFEVILKGPLAAKSIDDLMNTLQLKANKVKSRMDYLDRLQSMYTARDSEAANQQIIKQSTMIQTKIENQGQDIVGALEQQAVEMQKIRDMISKQSVDHDRQEQEKELRRTKVKLRICNALLAISMDGFNRWRIQQAEGSNQPPLPQKPTPAQSFIYQDELASFMAVGDSAVQDVSRVIQASSQFTMEEMTQAQTLFRSKAFKDWFVGEKGTLFLNGSGDLEATRVSSFSALLASLIVGISEEPALTVLHFFCGLHCDAVDPSSGPGGLIRSLIQQLTLTQLFELDFIDSEEKRQGLRDHDFWTLCDTFLELAYQLPPGHEVLCLIDGISWIETPAWQQELLALVAYLNFLDLEPRSRARFKILITCPTRSWRLTEEVRLYPRAKVVEVHSIEVAERELPSERELWGWSAV